MVLYLARRTTTDLMSITILSLSVRRPLGGTTSVRIGEEVGEDADADHSKSVLSRRGEGPIGI